MKKLYLIRHAKSSWKDMALDDFDRPLNKRGKTDAPFMAQKLKNKNIYPDIIISSPAKRAKSTAKAFKKIFDTKKDIIFDPSIYHAMLYELEEIIENMDNKYDTIFMVAHNPTINEFVEAHINMDENVPTCGIVGISFESRKWKDALCSNKKLLLFDYPKNHETEKNED